MMNPRKGWRLLSQLVPLLVASVACVGCDLATLAYFMMPEPRYPAKLKQLTSEDTESKVVLLAYAGYELRPEFAQVERELCTRLGRYLTQLARENKHKIEVVPQRKVEEYKGTHPRWHETTDLTEIGRHFEADHLVYLELNNLQLRKPGSNGTLFRGTAEIKVSIVDVNNPDEYPEEQILPCVYPSDARGAIFETETTPIQFRQRFLDHMARQLSWLFAPYRKQDTYKAEFHMTGY